MDLQKPPSGGFLFFPAGAGGTLDPGFVGFRHDRLWPRFPEASSYNQPITWEESHGRCAAA
jgi:hypothetical protein